MPIIETLVNSSHSWSGETYLYPKGQAEMTLLMITAPVGFRTPVDTHLQPGVTYVLRGEIDCVVTGENTKVFSAGDSFATTFGNTPHYCQSIGKEDAGILVAYAGVQGKPVSVPIK